MKTFLTVVLGALLSFGLTILSARILFNFVNSDSTLRVAITYVTSPLIALTVGAFAGLIVKEKAKIVATLSLVPWTLWLILTANWNLASHSQIAVTIIRAAVYLILGIAAAYFVSGRMLTSRSRQTAV